MTFDVTRLQVRRTRCDHCLYGPDPIPSRDRANAIRKGCKEDGTPFECRLGTLNGEKTRCRGWYDANQDAPIVRLAQHLGIVDFVDP